MKHTLAIALLFLGSASALAAEPESPDRVDPVMDCPSSDLDAGTPENAKWLRIQAGGDAVARELRETYAARLAGLFWDQQEGKESRLVLRLTGDEGVENRSLTVCGEPLIVAFITGQMHTREELQKLHAYNLDWFRGKFPGLQGTYADERTGAIVLEIYAPEAEGVNIEAIRTEVESRLGAPLRVDMITEKLFSTLLTPAHAPK